MAQYAFARLEPEYTKLWSQMHVTKGSQALAEARKIIAHKDRYQAQEKITRVPWFVAGLLNLRESGGSFTTWAHNGDPMHDKQGHPIRTVHVTKNRPPDPSVTWEWGCHDAYIVCEELGLVTAWSVAWVAYVAEKFNGFGYRNPRINIPSPYLWGGTSIQKRGKFVEDGPNGYHADVMDPQLGVMAVLWAIMELDPDAKFAEPAPAVVAADAPDHDANDRDSTDETPGPPPPPLSPRADDAESAQKGRLKKSRTIWGTVTSGFASFAGLFTGFFDKLDNPYFFAAFVLILIVLVGGGYMIVTGRINVQKLVEHLAEDDTAEE